MSETMLNIDIDKKGHSFMQSAFENTTILWTFALCTMHSSAFALHNIIYYALEKHGRTVKASERKPLILALINVSSLSSTQSSFKTSNPPNFILKL